MLSRESKAEKISRFSERLKDAEAIVVAENTGLTAQDMETLRARLRECGGSAQVVKNTLAKRALAGGRFEALADKLTGPLIYGVGKDPAQVAKIIADMAGENPKLIIRGGALPEAAAMDAAAVDALSKLPSREALLAQLAGVMRAPIAKFVGTLHAVPSGFARALAALRDQKADSDGGR